jgi:hypothetical protein
VQCRKHSLIEAGIPFLQVLSSSIGDSMLAFFFLITILIAATEFSIRYSPSCLKPHPTSYSSCSSRTSNKDIQWTRKSICRCVPTSCPAIHEHGHGGAIGTKKISRAGRGFEHKVRTGFSSRPTLDGGVDNFVGHFGCGVKDS